MEVLEEVKKTTTTMVQEEEAATMAIAQALLMIGQPCATTRRS